MKVSKVNSSGFESCYEIASGNKKLIVTTQVGPRIIFFGFEKDSDSNVLFVDNERKLGLWDWKVYGGHRFWVSPETRDSYASDNKKCEVIEENDAISFINFDEKTQLEKKLTISIEKENFIVKHTLTNKGEMLYYGGIWGLTCIPVEGVIFFPWVTPGDWRIKKIIYWEKWPGQSTNIESKQFVKGKNLFLVYPNGETSKVGTTGYDGFIGVANKNYTFVKKYDYIQGAIYPDDNCSIEVYTSKNFCELETLSPLTTLFPNYSLEHKEKWILFDKFYDPKEEEKLISIIKEY